MAITQHLSLKAACSSRGDGAVNEDFFGWTNSAAWVLDGATGVSDNKLPYPSDAYWFVRTFSRFLDQELLMTPQASTIDALSTAISKTRSQYGEHKEIETAPSAAFIMVRLLEDCIEVCSLGDCKALFLNDAGKLEYFYDASLEPFENKTLSALKEFRSQQPEAPQQDIIQQLKPVIRENRRFMNQPDGYSILSLHEIDANAFKIRHIPYRQNLKIAMMSDGFLRYAETLGQGSYLDLYNRAMNRPLDRILQKIRQLEHDDPECKKFVRVKRSDDATAIVVEVNL